MQIIDKKINREKLQNIANNTFGNMVKCVVDIEKNILAADSELHADLEAYLIEKGSNRKDLWGINLYPKEKKENFIEFNSLINVRPSQNNKGIEIEDKNIIKKIIAIVESKIEI